MSKCTRTPDRGISTVATEPDRRIGTVAHQAEHSTDARSLGMRHRAAAVRQTLGVRHDIDVLQPRHKLPSRAPYKALHQTRKAARLGVLTELDGRTAK